MAKERKEQLAKLKDDRERYQLLVEKEPAEVNTDAIAAQIVRVKARDGPESVG